jgi:Dimerisation domain
MATTVPPQQPTPERFFNTINAYEQTEAMKAAVELELFTAIAEGNTTAATIAKRCKAAVRGVRTLCNFLTIHGFLTKEGAAYALAPDAALFLDQHSPAYIGNAIEFLLTPRLREGHARLTEAVRRGGTALGEGTLEPENPDWVKFAQAMMPLMHMPAEIMATELHKGGEAHKVLDIAAVTASSAYPWQNRIPLHTSMRPIGRMCLKSQGRMRRQWELPIATTCFRAAPSKPILAASTIWC